jgi:putative nucleotidyltransferase with HDIG domain
MNLSPKGQLYVVLVATAGLLVIGHCVTVLISTPIGWEWVVLAGLTLLSGSFTVRVPSLQARLSVSETFVYTSVLLFGTCAGTLTVAIDILVASLNWRRKRQEPLRVLFNLTAAALSIWCAGHAFFLTAGVGPLANTEVRLPELLGPLVAMTMVYFLLNSGLVAIAISLERGEPAFRIWRSNFLWLSVNYFGGASVASLLVSYTRTIDIAALSIIVPLLVISYLTFKTSLGRVEDAVQHVEEVDRLYLSTIETLATAIDAKDQVTHGHIRRVQLLAVGLAKHLGVTDPLQIKALEASALLHDMGKIAVPEHILNKPSRLSAGEFEKMKLHATVGAAILSSIRFPYPIVPIVRHHHENWNGSGYPDGLKGTDIPLGARILSVVDCFDALTSDRPYRPQLSEEQAIEILMERRGTMYDPLVVDTFVAAKDELFAAIAGTLGTPSGVETLVRPSSQGAASALKGPAAALVGSVAQLEVSAFRAVLEAVEQELSTSVCVVYVRDRSRDELFAVDAIGKSGEAIIGTSLALGTRISGWVAANGTAIINSDARLELPDLGATVKKEVCIAIPIRTKSEISGVLVATRTENKPFERKDIAFVERVCLNFDSPPLSDVLESVGTLISKDRISERPTRVH